MKKNLLIIGLLAGLAALIWVAIGLKEETENEAKNKELSANPLSNFAIKDTANIDQIVITETNGSRAYITRGEGNTWDYQPSEYSKEEKNWIKGKKNRARQDGVELLLKTFYRISVQGPMPNEKATETMNKQIIANHKQIDIYKNGKLEKTWYVGSPTKTGYGTYVVLETPKEGRSPVPFIVEVSGFNGNINSRFFTTWRDWRYRGVFQLDASKDIESIKVMPYEAPEEAFTLAFDEKGDFMLFDSNSNKIENFHKGNARKYASTFQDLYLEYWNKLLDENQVDSLKNSAPPYYEITLTKKDGEVKTIKTWRKKMASDAKDIDGVSVDFDPDRVYATINGDEVVCLQFYTWEDCFYTIDLFTNQQILAVNK